MRYETTPCLNSTPSSASGCARSDLESLPCCLRKHSSKDTALPITKITGILRHLETAFPAAAEMPVSLFPPKITSDVRRRFHFRSLDHQRPLSSVTMAFSVGAFLTF